MCSPQKSYASIADALKECGISGITEALLYEMEKDFEALPTDNVF